MAKEKKFNKTMTHEEFLKDFSGSYSWDFRDILDTTDDEEKKRGVNAFKWDYKRGGEHMLIKYKGKETLIMASNESDWGCRKVFDTFHDRVFLEHWNINDNCPILVMNDGKYQFVNYYGGKPISDVKFDSLITNWKRNGGRNYEAIVMYEGKPMRMNVKGVLIPMERDMAKELENVRNEINTERKAVELWIEKGKPCKKYGEYLTKEKALKLAKHYTFSMNFYQMEFAIDNNTADIVLNFIEHGENAFYC